MEFTKCKSRVQTLILFELWTMRSTAIDGDTAKQKQWKLCFVTSNRCWMHINTCIGNHRRSMCVKGRRRERESAQREWPEEITSGTMVLRDYYTCSSHCVTELMFWCSCRSVLRLLPYCPYRKDTRYLSTFSSVPWLKMVRKGTQAIFTMNKNVKRNETW